MTSYGQHRYIVRDVDHGTQDGSMGTKVEAYDDERAAEDYLEDVYSSHEYYDRKGDIRIGVRPMDCKGCGGYGIMEAGGEDCPTCDGGAERNPPGVKCATCNDYGCLPTREEPCSRCVEQIFLIEVELVASCSATPEVFDHPTKPRRCHDCGERMDNGKDHRYLYRALNGPERYESGPAIYACTLPAPSPEVIDTDAVDTKPVRRTLNGEPFNL